MSELCNDVSAPKRFPERLRGAIGDVGVIAEGGGPGARVGVEVEVEVVMVVVGRGRRDG